MIIIIGVNTMRIYINIKNCVTETLILRPSTFQRRITHKVVINIVKQYISSSLTWRLVFCNIHFQKWHINKYYTNLSLVRLEFRIGLISCINKISCLFNHITFRIGLISCINKVSSLFNHITEWWCDWIKSCCTWSWDITWSLPKNVNTC